MLGDVCTITMGQAPTGDSYNDRGEGLPLIAGAGDFNGQTLKPTKFTTKPGKVSKAGDILLSIRASIGAKVWSDGEYCLGRGVAGLRPGSQLDDKYLWYWLTRYERDLASKGRGATFLQVNKTDISKMPIQLPPLSEQRRIAAILDHADALRVKRRQALAHLDMLTRSVFRATFADAAETSRLGDVATTTSGGTPNRSVSSNYGGGIPWVKSGELHTGLITETEETISAQGLASSSAKVFPTGTVLLAMYGATAGVVGRLGLDAATNQAICAITPGPSLNGEYLIAALRAQTVQLVAKAAGGAQPNLSQGIVRDIVIPVPSMDDQTRFANQVAAIDARRSDVARAKGMDAHLFASLQSRAFRGEL